MPHLVFNAEYNGVARELYCEAELFDPLTSKGIRVKKAVWDTGATNSAITPAVARALGLVSTGVVEIGTANGKAIVSTYLVDLGLPHSKVLIPGLNVTEADIGAADMLIGMDVIGLGDFTVQNDNGKTHFSFCVPPFDKKYNMLEKARAVNEREAKRSRRRR